MVSSYIFIHRALNVSYTHPIVLLAKAKAVDSSYRGLNLTAIKGLRAIEDLDRYERGGILMTDPLMTD